MNVTFWSKGVGRRYAHVVLRKADIDLSKRAGELTEEEVRRAWIEHCRDRNVLIQKGNCIKDLNGVSERF